MGTSYDIYCRTCNDFLWTGDCREKGILQDIIRNASMLASMARLPFEVVIQDKDRFIDPFDASWFAKHEGHDLVVRDEYGAFTDECSEWFFCECCGKHQRCRHPTNHEGVHRPKVPPCGACGDAEAPRGYYLYGRVACHDGRACLDRQATKQKG